MADTQTPFLGHAANSSSKLAAQEPKSVCPADAPGYNPKDFANQPGAAARAAGYPRSDGRPN